MGTESIREIGDNKKCEDCVHINRCLTLGYTTPDRIYCDFYPIRFKENECKKCNGFIKSVGHNYCSNCGRVLPEPPTITP